MKQAQTSTSKARSAANRRIRVARAILKRALRARPRCLGRVRTPTAAAASSDVAATLLSVVDAELAQRRESVAKAKKKFARLVTKDRAEMDAAFAEAHTRLQVEIDKVKSEMDGISFVVRTALGLPRDETAPSASTADIRIQLWANHSPDVDFIVRMLEHTGRLAWANALLVVEGSAQKLDRSINKGLRLYLEATTKASQARMLVLGAAAQFAAHDVRVFLAEGRPAVDEVIVDNDDTNNNISDDDDEDEDEDDSGDDGDSDCDEEDSLETTAPDLERVDVASIDVNNVTRPFATRPDELVAAQRAFMIDMPRREADAALDNYLCRKMANAMTREQYITEWPEVVATVMDDYRFAVATRLPDLRAKDAKLLDHLAEYVSALTKRAYDAATQYEGAMHEARTTFLRRLRAVLQDLAFNLEGADRKVFRAMYAAAGCPCPAWLEDRISRKAIAPRGKLRF